MQASMRFLERVPHYREAPTLSVVDANELTPELFDREYVQRMRPCLVRGAVRHWPGFERWGSLEYLRQAIKNPTVNVTTAPLVEPISAWPALNKSSTREMPFESFLAEITGPANGHRVLHAYTFTESDHAGRWIYQNRSSPLAAMAEDVGGFPFLPNASKPRGYPAKRAFMYRDSYTDWHYHDIDETLMCQVKGPKEVLLLPPDAHSLNVLGSINDTVGPVWDVDLARFPEWDSIRPYRVVVDEGDALYIPTFWWHAVESIGADFGWTVAWCWASPLHMFDPRLAGVRKFLKSVVLTKDGRLPLARAIWSVLSLKRLGRPPFTI